MVSIFGKSGKMKKAKTTNEMQDQILAFINEAITSGTGPLADLFGGFNEKQFEEGVSKPALKNFQENILPMINEKFIAGNQARGSALQRAQVRGASDLQSKLSELMYQAQQQQKQNQAAGVSGIINKDTYQNYYKQAEPGLFQSLLQSPAGSAGASAAGNAAVDAGKWLMTAMG